MLRRQNRRIEFTGGLEALSLQDYQVELVLPRQGLQILAAEGPSLIGN